MLYKCLNWTLTLVRALCSCVSFSIVHEFTSYECISADEKKLVEQVFTNAIDCMSEDDKKLPQVM